MTTVTTINNHLKNSKTVQHLKQIHSQLLVTGLFHHSLSSRFKLLDTAAVSAFGNLSYAVSIFASIPHPLRNDYNAVIRGHAAGGTPEDGVSLLVSMLRAPQRPDALTCSFALKACARAMRKVEARWVHALAVRVGLVEDVRLRTTLLDCYAKVGELRDARKVFDEMSRRDVLAWNAIIFGLAQGSCPGEALELFYGMRGDGVRADEVTVLGALSACSQIGVVREGDKVWRYAKEEGFDGSVSVCNAVIDMYSKCGFVDKAYDVFWSMRCAKNVITWTTMIMGFGMHGLGVEAIQLLHEMERSGIRPDQLTYLGVLCACNHAGMVDEGYELFSVMETKGVVRNVKHYGTVVDLLGRAGRLSEAYDIIKSMPFPPDVVLWQTLLGACKTYGNVELAEIASRKLVEMGSHSCGDFVLLSNVYASYGRWNDVGRVRDAMKFKDLRKVPGFSYTEVNGVLHRFINGDQSHPCLREIYAKLDEIMFRIKEHGHVAETRFVLHDIGDEDKEYVLSYHSEKLAVAFALLKSIPGTPIQVIKNLRICVDCHAVLKLVSEIYDREIIVRDRARFHRFKGGTCSCRDYW
ncbi:hypothetical protein vseg_009734 [Gypsophila vaccaria]